jgi:PKD repeat protein
MQTGQLYKTLGKKCHYSYFALPNNVLHAIQQFNRVIMKRIYLATLFALGLLTTANAQLKPCGTDEANERLGHQHPGIHAEYEEMQKYIREYIQNNPQGRSSNQVYIIPIVFHIIHQYGSENISDAQVLDAVRILNEDFRKLNADTNQIVPSFQSVAADCMIEFRLAQIDPDGNCTNGIDRIYSHETNIGNDGSKLNQWPRNKYLNVWTVKRMADGVAGYAYYPSSTNGPLYAFDGIIILQDYIGSIGTSNPGKSRALTHEVGHYLGLPHTWGSNNQPGVACGDDGIPDTPQTKGWTSCNLNGADCDPAVIENVQNFMEYAYCSKMFTGGQKFIMDAVLSSPVAGRNNLYTATNLQETGVLNTPVQVCAPVADFHANRYFVCEGGTITFTDDSFNGAVSSRTWSFGNGTPATSTAANPTVTFNAGGWQGVTLTVTNSAGTSTKTMYDYVYISPSWDATFGIHSEGFENAQDFSRYMVVNPENNAARWQRVTNAGYTGSSSIMLNNYSNDAGSVDEFITPAYDLSTTTGLGLTFKYTCATREATVANMNDELRVFSSTDCGATWVQRYLKQDVALVNAGLWPDFYVPPADPSLWSSQSITLPSSLMQDNVRFKFQFLSGEGSANNIYIDDINIVGVTDVNNGMAADASLSVYPNPSSGSFSITYSSFANTKVKLSLFDITGRAVQHFEGEKSEGEHTISINAAKLGLRPGVYFIEMESDNYRKTQKLVITN